MKTKLFILFLFITSLTFGQTSYIIHNPYAGVDWETYNHYRANLHAHTYDHGELPVDTLVEMYSNANYQILAITEHNQVVWPWTESILIYNKLTDPVLEIPDYQTVNSAYFPTIANGMLAINGEEPSLQDHMVYLLTGKASTQTSTARWNRGLDSLYALGNAGGLAFFAHPGRYNRTAGWYNNYFDDHREYLLGMEVYNQGNKYGWGSPRVNHDYGGDEQLWDAINKERAPDDLIWGFSNDDFHNVWENHQYRNYQHFLMPELTEEEFRTAITNGAFYFSMETWPFGSNQGSPTYGQVDAPLITGVNVDGSVITVTATGYDYALWFNNESDTIGTGNSIDVANLSTSTNFVRVAFYREVGGGNTHPRTHTQPFGLEITEVEPDPDPSYTLTLLTVGEGSIDADPDLVDYDNELVTLTAQPEEGWEFSHWTGSLTGSTNPQDLLMDGNKSVTAHFTELSAPDPPAINVYFVATDGNNGNPGTKEQPFLTIRHGLNQLSAGDTLYIRGGTYSTGTEGWFANRTGTEENPIVVTRYQDEEVFIEGTLSFQNIHYFKFFGITVQNIPQVSESTLAESISIFISSHITVEECVVRNIGGRGFRADRSANVYFINCDAYNIYNTLQWGGYAPGTAGNGFSAFGPSSDPNYEQDQYFEWQFGLVSIEGCRVWNVGNGGYAGVYNAKLHINNSWAFNTTNRAFVASFNSYEPPDSTFIVTNSVALYPNRKGFNNNNNNFAAVPAIQWYNNIVIRNQGREASGSVISGNAAFTLNMSNNNGLAPITIRNNVSYESNSDYAASGSPQNLTRDHNNFDIPLTLTEADFVGPMDSVSLVTAFFAPRKPDGSLPDFTNLYPSATSQLRDAGIDVGLPYYGTAPDLGPFQYNPDETGHTLIFQIENENGNAINNARITFNGVQRPPGVYTLHGIEEGTYDFSVNAPGYETYTQTGLLVEGDMEIQVVMNLNNYQINLSASPAAGGSVNGQGSYQHGQTVHVSAQANTGYNFVNWTENGNSVSTNPNYSFTATQNRNLVANFSVQTYTVSLSSNPTGAGTLTGAGSYNHNANVTINAQANTGYTFVNWTENGNVVSTNPQFSFNITSNRSFIANFTVNTYEIQATAIPAEGGSVTGAGTYSYGETANLTATAADDYTFTYWRENGNVVANQPEYSFTVSGNRNLTAHFAMEVYSVTLESNPTDAGILNGAGNYSPGDNVTINAQANTGYSFVNWTENGSVVSTNPQFSFTIAENREFTANFSINTYNITAVANPAAGGNVSGAGTYNHGQTASLQATAADEYNFVSWTENGNVVSQNPQYSFTVTQNRNLTANFAIGVFSVTLESNPTGAGILQGAGNYSPGDNVTIYAEPNPGFVFENWTDNGLVVSQDPQFSFEITGNRNFTANFSTEIYSLTLNPNPTFGGFTTGAGNYPHGQNVTAGAIPNPGFQFVSWTQNGLVVSEDAFYNFQIIQDRELTAQFAPNEYLVQVLISPEESGTVAGAGIYEHGQVVNLEAFPSHDYIFLHWMNNGSVVSTHPVYTFIASGNRDLVAVFLHTDELVRIDASSFPPGYAFIEGAGDYPINRRVRLNAVPLTSDYSFVGWMENGRYIGHQNPFLFNAQQDRSVIASFIYEPGELEVLAYLSIPETGYIYGAGNYSRGQTAILQVELNDNVNFLGWRNLAGQIVSRQNPYTFEVNRSMELEAIVELKSGSPLDEEFSLSVYPNPSDGRFTVNIREEALMTVHNSQGVALESLKVTPEDNQLNLGYLPSGVYILRFQTQDEVLSRKVIIK